MLTRWLHDSQGVQFLALLRVNDPTLERRRSRKFVENKGHWVKVLFPSMMECQVFNGIYIFVSAIAFKLEKASFSW